MGHFSAGHAMGQPHQWASGLVLETPEAMGHEGIGWHHYIFPTSFYIWACPV